MREALKNLNWRLYGLGENDFDNFVRITSELIEDRRAAMTALDARVREEHPDDADDILDDLLYYKGLEARYLWECCIVRLIGIFEGAIERHFLPEGRYGGYAGRVRALKDEGYIFVQEAEVREWVDLRNALAHSPPEAFRPAMIEETDALECCEVLKRAFRDLRGQKKPV
ncbi:MAG TPA: hypothetical protein PKM48_04600 [Parvularculaceae bacterium]|nr:hypothetical protein [Parvularculaceae bacterium]HNS86600.1 hypothetical protein [Parvularculaceae bacterium]